MCDVGSAATREARMRLDQPVSDQTRFEAAVAAELLAAVEARSELLQSIVEVARAIFLAQAASIALLDSSSRDFAFEAVAGQGAGSLVGVRFPAGQGVAGTVAQTGEPLIIDDLAGDPRFARDVASETGYIPQAMMVAPLERGERTLGVLSVLDRGRTGRTALQELELLVAFATQAALAVDVGETARHATDLIERVPAQLGVVARLAERIDGLAPARREAGLRLLADLDALLGDELER
jgi:GAF domain-containing protein